MTMLARVVCLSPFDEIAVKAMFKGRHDVAVVMVQPGASPSELQAACADADLVIADRRHKLRIDSSVLQRMRKCRLIQQAAVGFESIDHRSAAHFGIPVANAAGYNKDAVADWTVMAMIALIRRSFWGDRQLRLGRWDGDDLMRSEMMGHELGSMTVGIIGFGNVGSSVARRASAFGCRIIFYDPDVRTFDEANQVDLDTLLRDSDIVSVHAPLDVDTRRMIGPAELGKMKPGSYLINAARGPIVDEAALIEALSTKHLAGAGLDVYEAEPLSKDSPLRSLDNVVLAPHMGSATFEAEARLIEVVGDNLLRVLDGQPPLHVVNAVISPQSLTPTTTTRERTT